MSNPLLDALLNEPVLQANSLGTVTPNWVAVRTAKASEKTLIALNAVLAVRRAKTTYPGLLVISAGLFLIAAAAFASKQGEGAQIPMAVLGVIFLIFYFSSQRAALVLSLEHETLETASGSPREASAILKAIAKAQKRLQPDATSASV